MPDPLSTDRVATLRAVCDTVVPTVVRDVDPDGFWRRRATDVGADRALVTMLDGMPAQQRAGLCQLLDVLAEQGFGDAARSSREQILAGRSCRTPPARSR
jgi:hypothetical protein